MHFIFRKHSVSYTISTITEVLLYHVRTYYKNYSKKDYTKLKFLMHLVYDLFIIYDIYLSPS